MLLGKNKLKKSFYLNKNTIKISKQLLGKILVTNLNNNLTSGIIVETEAYVGINDKASHAYNNRKTNRTLPMYMKGGICYIYLCYGIHYLFNVVTNIKEIPHAVLIRSIKPLEGVKIMCKRRKMKRPNYNLTNGPGKLSQALGITKKLNGHSLYGDDIWIEDIKISFKDNNILSSSRIGVDYAGTDAKLPYRFYIKNNKWVS